MSQRSSVSSPGTDVRTSARTAVSLGCGIALSILTLAGSVGGPPAPLDLAVGWVALGCGVALWRVRSATERPGTLMVLTGLTWLAGGVLHRGPLAHLLLAWPSGRPVGPLRVVVALSYVDAVVESMVASDVLTIAFGVLLAGSALTRLGSSTGFVRRSRLPATAGAAAIGGLLASDAAGGLARGAVPGEVVVTAYGLIVAGLIITLAVDLRWGGWTRSAATGLVVELGSRSGASLRDRLAAVLGDPTLEVGYLAPDGGYVDDTGHTLELPPGDVGRSVMEVRDNGVIVSVIVHDAATLDDADLGEAVAAAARVAVANARLRTEIDGRITDLDASQRRILSAADDQRRRVERRLASGALARLGRVRTLLDDPAIATVIASARIDLPGSVGAAEDELRSFARGVYPPALASRGLAAAVEELALAGTLPVTVAITGGRPPVDVEATAYFVCAEAIANATKHARASELSVVGRLKGDAFSLVVADNGIGRADRDGSGLRGLRDRVAALGGTFDVDSPTGGGTTVRAVIPAHDASGPDSPGSP